MRLPPQTGSHFDTHIIGVDRLSREPIHITAKNKGGLIDSGQPSVTRPTQATHAQCRRRRTAPSVGAGPARAAGEKGAVVVYFTQYKLFSQCRVSTVTLSLTQWT